MHDIFSDWERRAILYHLQETGGRSSVATVAAHLVGWWRGRERPVGKGEPVVERVRRRLGHAHLVKLDDFGVVVYDPRTGTVRLTDEMKLSVSEPWADRGSERSGRVLGSVEGGADRESGADGASGGGSDPTSGSGGLS
jgi:hypothetical protein